MNKPIELTMQGVYFRKWDNIHVASTKITSTILKVRLIQPQGCVKMTILPIHWSKYRLFRLFQRLWISIRYYKLLKSH